MLKDKKIKDVLWNKLPYIIVEPNTDNDGVVNILIASPIEILPDHVDYDKVKSCLVTYFTFICPKVFSIDNLLREFAFDPIDESTLHKIEMYIQTHFDKYDHEHGRYAALKIWQDILSNRYELSSNGGFKVIVDVNRAQHFI